MGGDTVPCLCLILLSPILTSEAPLSTTVSSSEDKREAFLRTITPPEEDRRRYTTASWSGGYRWFRSGNVVPLEQYRRHRRDNNPNGNAA